MKSKQKQNQARHWPRVILFDLAHKLFFFFYLIHYLQSNKIVQCRDKLNNAIVSLKDWISMMSGHDANPIFFNKKNKDWTSRTLANPPPSTSNK